MLMELPAECPKITDPFPITLGDALEVWNETQASPKFAKRMKLDHSSGSIMSFISVTKIKEKTLSKEALQRRVEYIEDELICEGCNVARVIDTKEATVTCTKCCDTRGYNAVDTSFREGTQIHTPYLYNRSNHFKDHLKRFSARESTDIAEETLQCIRKHLDRRFRNKDYSTVTLEDVHIILKRNELAELYMHEMRIWSLITGRQPPPLSSHQEGELLEMFQQIEAPWRKHKPPARKNMLSYAYLIHKLSQMLGYDDIAAHFKLLKSRDKIVQQDDLWKKICAELNWFYVRTV